MGLFMHDVLDLAKRSAKPRKNGLTMVIDRAWLGANSDVGIAYADYIDLAKSTAQCLWVDEEIVLKNIRTYRERGTSVQLGGIPYEIAVLQGRQEEYMRRNRECGANVIEVENHAAGLTLDQMADEVRRLKDRGFGVVGEVGAKWADHDATRTTAKSANVQLTDRQHVRASRSRRRPCLLRKAWWFSALIGNKLENYEGQEQVLKVVNTVGQDNMIIEMWTARGNPNTPLYGWLVSKFGPDVNLA